MTRANVDVGAAGNRGQNARDSGNYSYNGMLREGDTVITLFTKNPTSN